MQFFFLLLLAAGIEALAQGPKTASLEVLGWTLIPTPVNTVYQTVVHPENDNILYLASDGGLFVSSDTGSTWKRAFSTYLTGENIAVDPTLTSRVYAASMKNLYVSDDRGLNWRVLSTLPTTIYSLAVSALDGTIYLGLANTPDAVGVVKSSDRGKTWTGAPFPTKDKNLIVWDVERDAKTGYLYAGFEIADHPQPYKPMYCRSKDGGQSWENISGPMKWHVIKTQIDPTSGTVYAMTEGPGLYRSLNGGDTIRYWNAHPGLTLLLHPAKANWLFGGNVAIQGTYVTEEAGGVYYSVDGGLTEMNTAGLRGLSISGVATNQAGTVFYAASYGKGLYRGSLPAPKVSPAAVSAVAGDPVILPCNGCLLPETPIGLQINGKTVPVTSSADRVSFSVPLELSGGTYNASFLVGGVAANFTLTVPAVAPPVIRAVTSLNFVSSPTFAQNELVTIFGLRLSGLPKASVGSEAIAGTLPWKTVLNGTSVLLDGVALPVQFSYTNSKDGLAQVNFQLPETMTPGTHQVWVRRLKADGTFDESNTWTIEGRRFNPVLLGNAAYPIFAQNITRDPAGGNFVSVDSPARPGDVITLYGTGFGLTTPVVPAGAAAAQLSKVTNLNSIYIDINPVTDPNNFIPYFTADTFGGAVATPQFPGLYQMSFRVPAGMAQFGDLKAMYMTLFLSGFRTYTLPFTAKN